MFILLPVGMDYRARRYPVVTFTLMGICTAIYLITLFWRLGGDATAEWDWERAHLWLIPSESHWWTFLTSIFVHGGFFHLLGNMVYLFLFGACVEDMIGRMHFILFYLVCGVGSALAYILFSPEHFASDIPEGGASGAISACIGGYLLLRAKAHIEFKWIIFLFFRFWSGEFTKPAWVVIMFWFLKDLGMMLLAAAANTHVGGTAFGAHVGGTLLGAGFIALEKIRLKRLPEPIEEEEEAPVKTVMPASTIPPARTEPRRVYSLHATPAVVATSTTTTEIPTIHFSWDGAQSGPFTPSQVRQMFVSGEIPESAVYWQEGMADWCSAEELREPGAA